MTILLGLNLELVQTEITGTKHYKDEKGNRLILYIDGSYTVEVIKTCRCCGAENPLNKIFCQKYTDSHARMTKTSKGGEV